VIRVGRVIRVEPAIRVARANRVSLAGRGAQEARETEPSRRQKHMARPHHIPFARLLLAGLTTLASVAPWGTPVHGAVPAGCTELIQNGGFEDGGEGWQQTSSGGYELISDFNPRTGSLGAYLAGYDEADDRLSQQVDLPADTIITLRAWWHLDTEETAGAFDQMTVSLLQPGGNGLADLVTVDTTAPEGIWDEIVVDLSAYAGQTVVLRFAAQTDVSNVSHFYIDDVGIRACVRERTFLPMIVRG
jgi:hypothetical protein